MKTVFVIPSWYPTKNDPVSGIFVKKQVQALCELSSRYRAVVGLWGQCDENVPFNRPKRIPSWLWNYAGRPRGVWTSEEGVNVISDRVIAWSHRLPLGGAARLLDVTRENLKRTIQRFGRVDIIHAYVAYPGGYIASVLSREFDIPYVLTEFMGPFPFPVHRQRNGDVRFEIRQAIEQADEAIVLSEYLRKRFHELALPAPIVIPFSVDHSRFSPAPRRNDGLTRMISCCRLVAEKGIFELVSSFAQALKVQPSIRLTLIGTGPAEEDLRAHATSLGVFDRIEWMGQQENDAVADVMASSDFFVLPSRFDTFGVVYVEAMACGLPVVATRCGGPDGFIGEEQGILVDVEDIDQLTVAILKMASTHNNYDRLKIRSYSESRFADPAVIDAISRVYDRILDRKTSPACVD